MKRHTGKLILFVAVLVVLAGGLYALKGRLGRPGSPAGFPQGGPPPGAPMGGPPGGPGGNAEFEKSHRYTLQLMRLVGSIGRLEDEGKAALTPQQAKSILSILQPLRERASLEETDARQAVKELQAVLTDEQRAAISAIPPERRFRHGGPPPGGPPPGGSRPSGPPPNAGPRPSQGFNPLNPSAGGPPDQQGPGGADKLFDDLKEKSAQAGG